MESADNFWLQYKPSKLIMTILLNLFKTLFSAIDKIPHKNNTFVGASVGQCLVFCCFKVKCREFIAVLCRLT